MAFSRLNNVRNQGWWVCARCGCEFPAGTLNWQNLIGSLRCPRCTDPPGKVLYSQVTDEIARILQHIPRYGEPEIEPKLIQSMGIDRGYPKR